MGGTALVAVADSLSRRDAGGSYGLFWAGVAILIVPLAVRLASTAPTRGERLALVSMLALGLYVAKVVYSPNAVAFSDEFAHWRSTNDIIASHHLFHFNPLIKVAPRYPGLGAVTSAFAQLSGASISTSGFVVIGAARLLLALGLFLLFERLSGSARVAGLACVIYAANPNFFYWTSQFAYESLALPLAVLVMFLMVDAVSGAVPRPAIGSVLLIASACVVAVVATHHLTSYALAAGLTAMTAFVVARRRHGLSGPLYGYVAVAVVALGGAIFWANVVAPGTGSYLGPVLSRAGSQTLDLIAGQAAPRKLFGSGGEVAPEWERVASLASVGLVIVAMPVGLWLLWRRRASRPIALLFAALAVLYPVLLPLRFVPNAQETSLRSSEFLFIGVGLVVATAVATAAKRAVTGAGRRAAVAASAAVVSATFVGGATASWAFNLRTPPDDTTVGVPRGVGAPAIAAATWMRETLGPGNRVASDRTDRGALGSYGDQHPVSGATDGVQAWRVLLPPSVDRSVIATLDRGQIRYVLVQRRLSLGLPLDLGIYFDTGEPGQGTRTRPVPPSTLGKFDRDKAVDRNYDNGDIQIYDAARLISP